MNQEQPLPNQPKKTNGVAAIFITAIMTTLLAGGGMYLVQENKITSLEKQVTDLQQQVENPENGGSTPTPTSASCDYNGDTYESGKTFTATDGCNKCTCNDGKVACTLMACE